MLTRDSYTATYIGERRRRGRVSPFMLPILTLAQLCVGTAQAQQLQSVAYDVEVVGTVADVVIERVYADGAGGEAVVQDRANWQVKHVGGVASVRVPLGAEAFAVRSDVAIHVSTGFADAVFWSNDGGAEVFADDGQVTFFAEAAAGDQDVELFWEIPGLTPRAAAFRQEDHLLVSFAPAPHALAEGRSREILWLVDNSTSMQGIPLEQARQVIERVTDGMASFERTWIGTYGQPKGLLGNKPIAVDVAGRHRLDAQLRRMVADGGASPDAVFGEALGLPVDARRKRIIAVITDGDVQQEDVAEAVISALETQGADAEVHVLGLNNPSSKFLERLAQAGHGRSVLMEPSRPVEQVIDEFVAGLERPVLRDVEIEWGLWAVDESHPVQLGDLMAGRTLTVNARHHGGAGPIIVRGLLAGEPWEQRLTVTDLGAGGALEVAHAHAALATRSAHESLIPRSDPVAIPEREIDLLATPGLRAPEPERAVAELGQLERRSNQLRERIWVSMATLKMMRDLLGADDGSARLVLRLANELPFAWDVQGIRMFVDGEAIYTASAPRGELDIATLETVLAERPIDAGMHELQIGLDIRWNGLIGEGGPLVRATSTFSVLALPDETTVVRVVPYRRGGMNIPYLERPAVGWQVNP